MRNFTITFSHPWLLLLLIPAIALTLFFYLRLARKYRRTRNRIVSMTLHALIMVLAITVLSGIAFEYDVPNTENEIILLVDASFSNEGAEKNKDEFVQTVLDEAANGFKVGVVTFGYDQVYAAKLTTDAASVYSQYLNAPLPDTSATDIAAALKYASGLFTNPQTAKIVLMTDGIETDGSASSVIRSISAEGIKVDTVCFPTKHTENEVQIIDVTTPDYNIVVGDDFTIGITVQSSYVGRGNVTLYDNDEPVLSGVVEFVPGVQTVNLQHRFGLPGMHELSFRLDSGNDTLEQNNAYYSYIYLEVYDKILVVESVSDESKELVNLLTDFQVDTVNINDYEKIPQSVEELREYDQVILVNIANSDMPEGFDAILDSYVHDVGGGLFTVGGSKIDPVTHKEVANTYNRNDMYGTLYQQMLPVQAINYTPPIAVMIIIDRSGSMDARDPSTGKSFLQLAKEGALSCLNALSERDWCGVMTLESEYSVDVHLTPMPQMSRIVAAIDEIESGGGTVFTGALDRAGAALKALTSVERRHIILVTDGEPSDKIDEFGPVINRYYKNDGITCSIVGIGTTDANAEIMKQASEVLGGGRFYGIGWNVSTLPRIMREELNVPEIKDVNYEPFTPRINMHTSVVNGINQSDMPNLEGYYGTKAKEGADVVLMGKYVPIYAQWKYGAGTVGSFMCDLNGTWSSDFISNTTGIRFINNVVNALFPTKNIRPKDIDVQLNEDNYTTQMSIYASLEKDESIEITVTSPPTESGGQSVQTVRPNAADGFSRASFVITQPGVHQVLIQKKDASGEVIAENLTYKTFSYSKEYNIFIDEEECRALLADIADKGKGIVVSDPLEIFDDFVRSLHRVYDPRLAFIGLAVVLFLLDIAVRKFKFKWPHELVRDYKAKKELENKK